MNPVHLDEVERFANNMIQTQLINIPPIGIDCDPTQTGIQDILDRRRMGCGLSKYDNPGDKMEIVQADSTVGSPMVVK